MAWFIFMYPASMSLLELEQTVKSMKYGQTLVKISVFYSTFCLGLGLLLLLTLFCCNFKRCIYRKFKYSHLSVTEKRMSHLMMLYLLFLSFVIDSDALIPLLQNAGDDWWSIFNLYCTKKHNEQSAVLIRTLAVSHTLCWILLNLVAATHWH